VRERRRDSPLLPRLLLLQLLLLVRLLLLLLLVLPRLLLLQLRMGYARSAAGDLCTGVAMGVLGGRARAWLQLTNACACAKDSLRVLWASLRAGRAPAGHGARGAR
jgi:hypothetical protein